VSGVDVAVSAKEPPIIGPPLDGDHWLAGNGPDNNVDHRRTLVGNTGNSTEPHLHFHLADRGSAFDAEGILYVYSSFDLEAAPEFITPAIVPFGNSLAIDESGLARWRESKPRQRQRELPMRNAIVSFGNR
jgi:hypothetical protein